MYIIHIFLIFIEYERDNILVVIHLNMTSYGLFGIWNGYSRWYYECRRKSFTFFLFFEDILWRKGKIETKVKKIECILSIIRLVWKSDYCCSSNLISMKIKRNEGESSPVRVRYRTIIHLTQILIQWNFVYYFRNLWCWAVDFLLLVTSSARRRMRWRWWGEVLGKYFWNVINYRERERVKASLNTSAKYNSPTPTQKSKSLSTALNPSASSLTKPQICELQSDPIQSSSIKF